MKRPVTYGKVRKRYLNSMEYMRKKMWSHMTILSVIALGVIVYAVFCTVYMKNQDTKATKEYVENYTGQIANMIKMDVNDVSNTVCSLSKAVEEDHARGDLENFLRQKRALYNMDFIAVCDLQGDIETIVGEFQGNQEQMEEVKNEKTFREALDKQSCGVGVSDGYVLFAKNLYQNGEKTGTFWVGNKEEKLRNIFTTKIFQKEKSGSFILDGKGEILLASNPDSPYTSMTELLEQGKVYKNTIENISKEIAEGRNSVFEFREDSGKKFFFTCIGIGINDWAAVTAMPSDLFTGFSDVYVKEMLACILAVFIIFFAFFMLLFRSNVENGGKLERLAFVDEITGGINRTEFRIRYHELCRKQKADQFTLVLMDCEDFKMINKSLGDKNGDKMLKYFYSVISDSLKKEQEEFVSRTEMDHFFIFLREKEQDVVRERIGHIVERINSFQDTDISRFDVSFWLGACPVENNDLDLTLLQDRVRAVVQRQTTKETGTLIYYDKGLSEKMEREQELEHLFEESFTNGDFHVYFQPKVNVRKKKVSGAEALVRWFLPGKGMVSPGEFIPLLEKNGKIIKLDRYVFEKTCMWIKNWCDQGNQAFPISVNLSRSHFVDENFLEDFVKISDEYQIEHSLIEFEITEAVLLDASQIKNVREGLQMIHQYGFKCSIDDFGTGYSSLSLLQEFDIDTLKLDRSFFQDIHNSKARDVVACIVDIAKKLDMKTVVEGIETLQQVEYLQEMQCGTIQGFFFSRPLPVQEFEQWVCQFEISEYLKSEE